MPSLTSDDRPHIELIIREMEKKLEPCNLEQIALVFTAFKAAYPNDTVFMAEFDENDEIIRPTPLEARVRLAHKILSEVPEWLIEQATIEAIRETARSSNPRDRSFMPTDAAILAAALPHIEPLQAQLVAAQRLLRKIDGELLA